MLEEVITDADERMGKTLDSLQQAFQGLEQEEPIPTC